MAVAAGCSVGGIEPRGDCRIRLPDTSEYPEIAGAIVLLREKEPELYGALAQSVRRIDISLHHDVSHPYYDTIYISRYALSRGAPYAASVILHELVHVAINGIRRGNVPSSQAQKLLRYAGIDESKAGRCAGMAEEAIAYNAQYKFLLKHGSGSDIEYQRLRMKVMFGKSWR